MVIPTIKIAVIVAKRMLPRCRITNPKPEISRICDLNAECMKCKLMTAYVMSPDPSLDAVLLTKTQFHRERLG